ncbi:MAG: hypothetical protein ACYSOT_04360 [Planctomycetota bacterium]|jgi:hypothetical protein
MNPSHEELFDSSVALEQQYWTSDALADIPTSKGVLLFIDNRHQPIQLLISANIRRLIANRIEQLSEDQPSKRSNIVKVASRIYYKQTWNDFQSRLFYNLTARQCFPDTYDEWVDLPKPHFVILDKTAKCPSFRLSEKPKFYGAKNICLYGLFPSRKAADHYCHVLNTVHGLCRNPSIVCTQKANTCTYFQMDQCSGYCMGNISRQTYLNHVGKAIHFSAGSLKPSDYINNLKPEMRHLGRIQEYEKAQRIKEKIELLKSLDAPAYHWTGLLHGMDIFHMDRSIKVNVEGKRGKQQTYNLYRITWNCIDQMNNVPASNIKDALEKIISDPDEKTTFKKNKVAEHLAVISRFIYRKNNNGLWVRRPHTISMQTADLMNRIHEKFPEVLTCAEKKNAEKNSASSM